MKCEVEAYFTCRLQYFWWQYDSV